MRHHFLRSLSFWSPLTHSLHSARSSSTKAQLRKREALLRLRSPQSSSQQQQPLQNFSVLLRQLLKNTHPDILRARDMVKADENDKAWQTLNGILSTIKDREYPPAITQSVELHLKDGDGGQKALLRLKTAGGDCKRAVTISFHELFKSANLTTSTLPDWTWDENYFTLPTTQQAEKSVEEEER